MLIRPLRKLARFKVEDIMKRVVAILLAGICVHGLAIGGYTQGDPPPMCMVSTRNPDVYTFYGDTETVNRKLGHLEDEMDVQTKRLYFFVVEAKSSVDMYLFEKVVEGKVKVSHLRSTSYNELNNLIHSRTLRNEGEVCNGEVLKSVLKEQKAPMDTQIIAAPASAREAFKHAAKGYEKAYLAVQYQARC